MLPDGVSERPVTVLLAAADGDSLLKLMLP